MRRRNMFDNGRVIDARQPGRHLHCDPVALLSPLPIGSDQATVESSADRFLMFGDKIRVAVAVDWNQSLASHLMIANWLIWQAKQT